MTAALARRLGTAALTASLTVAIMLVGAGSASAQPRAVVCTIGGSLNTPVQVTEGDRVQLVLDVLGIRVNVGPPQTATPGTEVLSGTVAGVIGLVGQLCRAAVQVHAVVTSVVPIPSLPPLPTLPPLLPSSVVVPIPGVAEVGVGSGGGGQQTTPPPGTTVPPTSPPGGAQPPGSTPGAPSDTPGFRFERGGPPLYDFSRAPYGVSDRFGAAAAPAFRFGQKVPGYAPQFGVLDEAVTNAGDARALPAGGSGAVALPVLLAVLMLSAVAGALVRTWVLRRAV